MKTKTHKPGHISPSVVMVSLVAAVIVVSCLQIAGAQTIAPPQPEIRAVWASTLSPCLSSPEEIQQLVAAVRVAHLNTIIIQVRQRGVVYYKSELEPRAPVISKLPGFDPLAALLKEAHDTSNGKARLDVSAWFNVFPAQTLQGLEEAKPAPVRVQHPDWLSLNRKGEKQQLLDPGIPAVQDYLIAVVEECLRQYDVDGVNLDFVRYSETEAGYHPTAIARFNRLTGHTEQMPAADDAAWNAFQRDQVTAFVRRCAVSIWKLRPQAMFSIDAVGFGGPPVKDFSDSSPYKQVFQDWAGWIRQGYLDVVCRMGYKREFVPLQAQHFRGWADFSRQLQDECPGRYVTLGIGGYLNSTTETLAQYREAQKRTLGTSLFSYWRPTREASETKQFGPASPFWGTLGKEIYKQHVPVPRPEWRKKHAVVAGVLRDSSGRVIDGEEVKLQGTQLATKSDGAGFFVFSLLKPGTYRIKAPGATLNDKEFQAGAGSVTSLE